MISARLPGLKFADPKSGPMHDLRYSFRSHESLGEGRAVGIQLSDFTLAVTAGCLRVGEFTIAAGQGLHGGGGQPLATAMEPETSFVLAGIATGEYSPAPEVFSLAEAKRVSKPWGYELWLSGEGRPFCLKKLLLRAGHRTSLQYHRVKHETNFLVGGSAELSYLESGSLAQPRLATLELHSPCSVDISPMTLHRLRAISDLTMFEASTPELDDVVRISDDTFRGDGRIIAEH